MATTLSVRPSRAILGGDPFCPTRTRPRRVDAPALINILKSHRYTWGHRHILATAVRAGSRADDSAPFEMSVENALKVLGVSEGASFDDILRAKNSILATCKDDQETIAQVEAAYDMLLMQRLSQRRAGKVVSSSIRYADAKPVNAPRMGSMPKWLQTTGRSSPISVETPSTTELGLQAGVYGALMVLTYFNGASAQYSGADVPGLILATSFGASLYFLTKKKVKLGEEVILTLPISHIIDAVFLFYISFLLIMVVNCDCLVVCVS
ncbi:CHAPERONE-LIKE PROTEIN OF POR1, chloroplastic [Olea europaea subsp. europaea]|uniref:CHAPERONE-LIKE PROTEIN OF POR1, chloroplastic n=1 Tax=Olea europaea subsp. europaea TaxID=158383 RepID=A0A8S0SIZ5_OLEEU|nr:CHAPERONE-LIKE PROTEIN OF POR1, chloroplastic [Olea europaea subsp. europaea]